MSCKSVISYYHTGAKKSQPESYTIKQKETKIHTKKQTKNNTIANKEDQVAGRRWSSSFRKER